MQSSQHNNIKGTELPTQSPSASKHLSNKMKKRATTYERAHDHYRTPRLEDLNVYNVLRDNDYIDEEEITPPIYKRYVMDLQSRLDDIDDTSDVEPMTVDDYYWNEKNKSALKDPYHHSLNNTKCYGIFDDEPKWVDFSLPHHFYREMNGKQAIELHFYKEETYLSNGYWLYLVSREMDGFYARIGHKWVLLPISWKSWMLCYYVENDMSDYVEFPENDVLSLYVRNMTRYEEVQYPYMIDTSDYYEQYVEHLGPVGASINKSKRRFNKKKNQKKNMNKNIVNLPKQTTSAKQPKKLKNKDVCLNRDVKYREMAIAFSECTFEENMGFLGFNVGEHVGCLEESTMYKCSQFISEYICSEVDPGRVEFLTEFLSIIALCTTCARSDDTVVWISATIAYIAPKLKENLMFLTGVTHIISGVLDATDDDDVVTVDNDIYTEHNGIISSIRAGIKSANWKHFGIIATVLATVGFIDPCRLEVAGFKIFSIETLKKGVTNPLDFFDQFLGAVEYLWERGWQCYREKSFSPLIYGPDGITYVHNKVSELKSQIRPYLNGNYKEFTGNDDSHFDDLIVKVGQRLEQLRNIHPNPVDQKIILELKVGYSKVNEQYLAFKKQMGVRIAPMCVKLFGGSSVGKSSICVYVRQALMHANGFLHGLEHEVTIDTNTEWDSNMRSNVTTYILDDLANSRATVAKRDPAETIIRIVNNIVATANMPCAEDKGKVLIQPKLLMITTNNELFDCSYWSINMKSVIRRCHLHVKIEVKPEWQGQDGSLEAVPDPNDMGDYWLITVKVPIYDTAENFQGWRPALFTFPGDSLPTKLRHISLAQFLTYAIYQSFEYYEKQDAVVDNLRNPGRVMKFCTKCKFPGVCCKCVIEQTGVLEYAASHVGRVMMSSAVTTSSQIVSYWWDRTRKNIIDTIFPNVFETNVLSALTTGTVLYYRECFMRSNPGLTVLDGMVPTWMIQHPLYQTLDLWLQRRMIHRRSLRRASAVVVGCLLGSFCFRKRTVVSRGFLAAALIEGPIMYCFWYSHNLRIVNKNLIERRDLHQAYSQRAVEQAARMDNSSIAWLRMSRFATSGLTLAGALGLVALFKTFYNTDKKEQGALFPTDTNEISQRDEEINVWEVSEFSPVRTNNMTPKQAINRIQKNLWTMRYKLDDKMYFCNCLHLATGWILMPYHVWFAPTNGQIDINGTPSGELNFMFIRSARIKDGKTIGGTTCNKKLSFSDVRRIEQYDLCIVRADVGGVFNSVIDMFPSNYQGHGTQYNAIHRDSDGKLEEFSGSFTFGSVNYIRNSKQISYPGGQSISKREWRAGDCCTPLISCTTNPLIIGLHLLGKNKLQALSGGCFASPIKGEILNTIKQYCTEYMIDPICECGPIPSRVMGQSIDYNTHLDEKHLVNYVNGHNINVLGSYGKPVSYKTNFQKSMIFDAMEKYYGPCMHIPTPFKANKQWEPHHKWLKNVVDPMGHINNSLLATSYKDYISAFNRLKTVPDIYKFIRPLSEEEIVNGIDGVRFIDAMKKNTAIGFPFNGKKHKYLEENDGKFRFANPNIMLGVAVMEAHYKRGDAAFCPFKTCCKDEIVAKYKDGKLNEKVRIFNSAPLSLQIIIRKYFLPICRLISLAPLESECAVGINCFGPEYNELRNWQCWNGTERIVCGDYSGWDQRLSPQLIRMGMKVFIHLAHLSGNYSNDDLLVMQGVVTDIAYPIISIYGGLIRVAGSNPSGQNITAHLNSVCNALLMRCAYFSVGNTLPFRTKVRLITYGDDVKASVLSDTNYDFLLVQRYFASINIKFTNADKTSGENPPYIDNEAASFLKRIDSYIPELGVYIGKLEKSSIDKSLRWTQKSPVGEINVMASVFQTAIHEYFAHGRVEYDTNRAILENIALQHGIVVDELAITFDDRVTRWKDKYSAQVRHWSMEKDLKYSKCYVLDDTLDIDNDACRTFYNKVETMNSTEDAPVIGKGWFSLIFPINKDKQREKRCEWDKIPIAFTVGQTVTTDCEEISFEEHSGNVQDNEIAVKSRVVQYHDAEPNHRVDVPYRKDNTFTLMNQEDVSLEQFLSRPMLIDTVSISVGTTHIQKLTPLRSFLSKPTIKNKLQNYAFLDATIHVKFVMNGSPFHYGAMVAGYEPYPRFSSTNAYPTQQPSGPFTCQIAQLPSLFLDFSTTSGGELVYPITHIYGALDLTTYTEDFDDVECVWLRALSPLRSLNETTQPVTMLTYVWLTDVRLSLSTVVEQSGEYMLDNKTTAQTVSHSDTPRDPLVKIKEYGLATMDVLGKGLEMAQLMGFSNPSVVPESRYVSNRPISSISYFNVLDTSQKLTLDSKQETTVDGRALGFDSVDELNIVHMANREFETALTTWATADVKGTQYMKIACTPCQSQIIAPAVVIPSPSAMAAVPFSKWRGSMKFRLMVLSSAMHKGRLRITYEPIKNTVGADRLDASNVNHSYVIDIAQTRNFEFCVGHGSSRNYLNTVGFALTSATVSPSEILSSHNRGTCFGYVTVCAETPLTTTAPGPSSSAGVTLVMYTSMRDDFEVADPDYIGIQSWCNLTEDVEQSGVMDVGYELSSDKPTQLCLNNIESRDIDGRLPLIHYGEDIRSWRQVLKRYTHHHVRELYLTERTLYIQHQTNSDFPFYRGNAANSANDPAGVANICRTTPLNILSSCFLAKRGSIRWKVFIQEYEDGITYDLVVARHNNGSGVRSDTIAFVQPDVGGNRATFLMNNYARIERGATIVQTQFNNCVEYEVPYHYPERFKMANNTLVHEVQSGRFAENSHRVSFTGRVPTDKFTRVYTTWLVAAGDDFTFHFWKYTSILYPTSLNYYTPPG